MVSLGSTTGIDGGHRLGVCTEEVCIWGPMLRGSVLGGLY